MMALPSESTHRYHSSAETICGAISRSPRRSRVVLAFKGIPPFGKNEGMFLSIRYRMLLFSLHDSILDSAGLEVNEKVFEGANKRSSGM